MSTAWPWTPTKGDRWNNTSGNGLGESQGRATHKNGVQGVRLNMLPIAALYGSISLAQITGPPIRRGVSP